MNVHPGRRPQAIIEGPVVVGLLAVAVLCLPGCFRRPHVDVSVNVDGDVNVDVVG